MPGLGTIINVGAIALGTVIGALLGNRLPQKMRETAMDGLGLVCVVIGLTMAIKTQNILYVMGAVLLGGITGELLKIERGLERLGDYFQSRFSSGSSTFATGFVTASLIFCIGPMAVLGAIDDGLRGDITILVVKAMLDGVTSLAFAATLGWGVGLSILPLAVYQGGITLAAGMADKILSDVMITEMTATGGLLVLAIALRILNLKQIRVGNFLPALVFAPLLVALIKAITG
jgi:uncharacterized membrane protein YqgA involved in biofilm formation